MERKVSILIVDDNASLCKTMSFVLGRKGYAVTTAGDGPEAIERVKERPFDMIFMDGVETYKRVNEVRPDAMGMMMTAYVVEDLVQEALEEGACGIVYKPLDIEEVIAIIEEAVESKKRTTILVVDDDPWILFTLQDVLANQGYEVGMARTGEEAIAMAQEDAYDILLIDLKLPTISGLKTCLAIKEVNPEAVAIMMTGYREEMSGLVDEAMQNHAYSCLYKPFHMAEMLRLVGEISERKQKAG